jgi:hypothetical protein
MRSLLRRPSAPMLVALLALFIALGGPAYAERIINGSKIKRGTVTSKQLKNRSVKQRDLTRATVRALRATPDRSVTASKLAPGSVGTDAVGENALTAADLAANSVGTDEIGDNAVGQSEIRGNGVAASEIADNSIDGGEIIDGGLSVRDVARLVGPFTWTIGSLPKGVCETAWVQVPAGQIAGDFILISPVSPAWPRDLTYSANATSSETEFKVQACNHTGTTVAGSTYTFNYAVLGN